MPKQTSKQNQEVSQQKQRKVKKVATRDPMMCIFAGMAGTGKSYKAFSYAQKYKRVLIVTFGYNKTWKDVRRIDLTTDDVKTFEGVRWVWFADLMKDTFKHIHNKFRNGLIIFDDCQPYIDPNMKVNGDLNKICVNFRHTMSVDIFFVVHVFHQVPPNIWANISYIFMFAVNRKIDSKIPIDEDKIKQYLKYQRELRREFLTKKRLKNNSHRGIFKLIRF